MSDPRRLLIAVDVDGTLVDTEMAQELRAPEIAAVRRVREAGHVLALCTGRSARSVESVVRAADGALAGSPMILLNGALVLADGGARVLRDGGLPRETAAAVVGMFLAAGALPLAFDMESDGGGLRAQRLEPNPVLGRYLERRLERVGEIALSDDLAADLPHTVQEVGTIEREPVVRELAAAIRARFGEEVWVVTTETLIERDSYRWLEVMPPHCHKGSGLELLAAHLEIPRERVVAIGDNYNDLDMFLAAGHSVAMGNAPADVRAVAGRVAPSVSEHGAAVVLDEIARGAWPLNPGGSGGPLA
ncbi:HAD hydrolase family protein [bacterium]|nr:HAD hydrolase family protein [bacterium]